MEHSSITVLIFSVSALFGSRQLVDKASFHKALGKSVDVKTPDFKLSQSSLQAIDVGTCFFMVFSDRFKETLVYSCV
jgi:hypothetical protein